MYKCERNPIVDIGDGSKPTTSITILDLVEGDEHLSAGCSLGGFDSQLYV